MNYCHVSFITTSLLKQKESRWRNYFSIALCIWTRSVHYALCYTFTEKVSICCSKNHTSSCTYMFTVILMTHTHTHTHTYIGNIHTAEPLVPEPSVSEVELSIEKLKSQKSPDTDQIPAELIKAGGKTICCEIHKLIISIWNKEQLPEERKELIIVFICRVVNWQLMHSHLDRYWAILPSRSNGCCNWGDKLYSRWEETTEFIVLTPRRYWQTLSAWLPVWECHVRLGKQVIELNITITQSDPNSDMAYKDLQRFQSKGMVLGNSNIISPLWVRGLDYRSRSEFSCHNNKVDGPVPFLSGLRVCH